MALIGASIDILSNNLLASVMRIVEDAKAKDKVYLVSPYLQFNTNLEDVLDKAAKEGVDVRLIYRKGYELKAEDRKYLATSKIDFRCLEHLHAKLYVSDFTALVTSLNLYNYSDKESRELGILIKDSKSVRSLFDTAEAWWDKADKVDKAVLLNRNLKQTKSSTEKQSEVDSVYGVEHQKLRTRSILCVTVATRNGQSSRIQSTKRNTATGAVKSTSRQSQSHCASRAGRH